MVLLSIGHPLTVYVLRIASLDFYRIQEYPLICIKIKISFKIIFLWFCCFSKRLPDKMETSGADIGQVTGYSECTHQPYYYCNDH